MKFNQTCNLFLRDIFLYDIKSCHFRILEKYGFDVSHLDKENKLKRNIQIGKMMQRNPRLISFLRIITKTIVDEFISQNKITKDEIILRQYDGIIITKTINITNQNILIPEFRSHFQNLIISTDRKSYIAFDITNNKDVIKGISHNYENIKKIYSKLIRINFAYRDSIFRSLQKIKDEFINSNNPLDFCIPVNEHKSIIFLKQYGEIEISKSTINIMDINDIDKKKYFDFYISPFIKTIVYEFVKV